MNRSIYLLSVLLLCLEDVAASRFERIAGYQPHSSVADIAAIDQDLKVMEERLVQQDFEQARRYYREGANSQTVAFLTLDKELPVSIPKDTLLIGSSDSGTVSLKQIQGTLYVDAYRGDSTLIFRYNASPDPYESCRVGGHPIAEQVLNGCLQRQGNITVLDGDLQYSYDPYADNNNGRTLQNLSDEAKRLMYDCPHCPREDFVKFRAYYGQPDYADAWISAAFDGVKTSFLNGNADFSIMGLAGRSEAIKKGVSYMSTWMYVIGLMESALEACQIGCVECNMEAVKQWDEAVAVYAGSLEGTDGSGHGFLSYELADKRCADFRTCGRRGDKASGTSFVNHEIFNLFGLGQMDIMNGVCDPAHDHKRRIVRLMTVPLIQSTLKYAYIRDRQASTEKEAAEAAVAAASILPIIHDCSKKDALTVWEYLGVLEDIDFIHVNFVHVKKALQRNYKCLQITCDDIGGLYDTKTLSYFKDASPCHGNGSGLSVGAILLITAAVILSVFFVTCCCLPLRRRRLVKKKKRRRPRTLPEPGMEEEMHDSSSVEELTLV